MTLKPTFDAKSASQKPPTAIAVLLTPKEAADFLKVSTSWLAKARMRGDGPPYIKFGRAVRYDEVALLQWIKSQQRLSTSSQ
jgi:predicted DNA-binding transcriptional regulator AlpA